MPSLAKIAEFHHLGDEPFCVRCGYSRPGLWTWATAGGWLDRAHLIDRGADGLDIEPNLLPLCRGCHSGQPYFENGDEAKALMWFRGGPTHAEFVAHLR